MRRTSSLSFFLSFFLLFSSVLVFFFLFFKKVSLFEKLISTTENTLRPTYIPHSHTQMFS